MFKTLHEAFPPANHWPKLLFHDGERDRGEQTKRALRQLPNRHQNPLHCHQGEDGDCHVNDVDNDAKKLPEKFYLTSEGAAKEDCGPSQAQADASSRVQRLKLPDFGDWHSSLKNLQFTSAVETVFKVSETIWGAIQYNDKREARLRGFCASTHFRKKKKVKNTILESRRKIVFSKYIQCFHFLQLGQSVLCSENKAKLKYSVPHIPFRRYA